MKRPDPRRLLVLLCLVVASAALAGVFAGCGSSETSGLYPSSVAGFGADRFLATSYSKDWSRHQDELTSGVNLMCDRLYCLDTSAEVRWSLVMYGWTPRPSW